MILVADRRGTPEEKSTGMAGGWIINRCDPSYNGLSGHISQEEVGTACNLNQPPEIRSSRVARHNLWHIRSLRDVLAHPGLTL